MEKEIELVCEESTSEFNVTEYRYFTKIDNVEVFGSSSSNKEKADDIYWRILLDEEGMPSKTLPTIKQSIMKSQIITQ